MLSHEKPLAPSISLDQLMLGAKLCVPHGHEQALKRPRLISVLNLGLHRKLTLITAPAGYGKTTLVSSWCSQVAEPVGWISLDKGDNDLLRFWQYVAASIYSAFPDFVAKTKPLFHLLKTGDVQMAIISLLNELGRMKESFILILDDFHAIRQTELLDTFNYFVDFLPRNVHVYVISRDVPKLPLARMELNQDAIHLKVEELKFNEPEGIEFFDQVMGLQLSESAAGTFVTRTEGWIAAMKLAALAMEKKNAQAVLNELHGHHQLYKDYLLDEVFNSQSEVERIFMMKCSVLRRMNASLCQHMTGYSAAAAMLDELVKRQLFIVPLGTSGEWYRFHPLLAEFLQTELLKIVPDFTDLYLEAAAWCISHLIWDEAIEYYLAAKSYEQAADLLEQMGDHPLNKEWSIIQTWLAALPESVLMARPALHFSYMLTLLFARQKEAFEHELLKAQALSKQTGSLWTEEQRESFLGNLALMQTLSETYNNHNNFTALQTLQNFKGQLPYAGKLIIGLFDTPLQPSILGVFQGKSGQLQKDIAGPFLQHMHGLVLGMNQPYAVWIQIAYGEVLWHWNELQEAEECLQQAISRTDQLGDNKIGALIPGWVTLAKVYSGKGRNADALHLLHSAKQMLMELGHEEAIIYVEAELAHLALLEGDKQPALSWIEQWRLSPDDPVSIFHLHSYLHLARFLTNLHRQQEAYLLLEQLRQLADREKRPVEFIEAVLLQALCLAHMGRRETAILRIGEAMRLAEAEGFISLFVREGAYAAGLITAYASMKRQDMGKNAPSLHFIRKIGQAIDKQAAAADKKSKLVHTLTPKELDVLQYLAKGLSNREIASELGIGMGTIKTHINRIYSKLEVNNRLDAIGKALEAGVVE